jgi:hypothetical protein
VALGEARPTAVEQGMASAGANPVAFSINPISLWSVERMFVVSN